MNNKFTMAVLLVGLLGCTTAEDIEETVTSSARAPISFAVNELIIANEAPPPTSGDFKDKRNSARLVDKTREFLQGRLRAGGGEGWVKTTIVQADLVERALETTPGIKGILIEEADAEFVGALTVRIAVMDAQGLEVAYVEAKVGRTRPISESIDVLGRTAEAEILIGDLLKQLDDQLTRAVDIELEDFKSF